MLLSLLILVGLAVGAVFLVRWCVGAHTIAPALEKLGARPVVCECRCP